MAADKDPIPPVVRDDPAAHSGDVVAENVAALKALFPSIVTDGKVDFNVLRQLLGDEVENGAERYGLNWKGKARARAFALTPSLGTLRPAKEDSKDWDNTKNVMIEGDNLEVLKLLRKSYAGKVKLIYIDPPYNTGKDFVYPDDYAESLSNYEALTGQRGDDGARLTSNKESSGRYHTDWLSMMYPRLMLAKELLRDDGMLIMSIDEGEVTNAQKMLEEILGIEGFVELAVWKNKYGSGAATVGFASVHEFALIFSKKPLNSLLTTLTDEQRDTYRTKDEKFAIRGGFITQPLATRTRDLRENLIYPLVHQGEEIWPEGQWIWQRDRLQEAYDKDELVLKKTNGKWSVRFKQYLRDENGVERLGKPVSVLIGPYNQDGTAETVDLMGRGVFSFPKPVALIQYFVRLQANGPWRAEEIVLDFFAGSGTTGHAVMSENANDHGSRRYILVQLPEPLDPKKSEQKTAADFCDNLGKPRNIAELTKERLRRAGEKVQAEHPEVKLDTGFRVYKLATSNLKPWQPGDDLARDLLDGASNVLDGRSEDDLLVELLLKTGIDLALPGETREIAGRTVHLFGGGTLVVCLADIPAAEARELGDGIADWLDEVEPPAPTTFFFKDSGFDSGGTRSAEARANLAATLRQRLGEDAIEKLGAI